MPDNLYITTGSALTSIADAIRERGGTSAELEYPTGFVSAIAAIPGGSGSPWSSGIYAKNGYIYISPNPGAGAQVSGQFMYLPKV